MSGRRRYRVGRTTRHAGLAGGSAVAGAFVFAVIDSPDTLFRLSMATAYVSLALLVAALALGPLNLLRQRPNPVSTNLRRDVGIWSALFGFAHVVVGLQVHLRGRMWQYFLFPPEWDRRIPLRYDPFGIANWTGLGAALVLLLLVALSNDVSLRRLGAPRWKVLQQSIYVGFCLLVLHGALYQIIERREWLFVAAFCVLVGAAVGVQLAGVATRLRGRASAGSAGVPRGSG